MHCKTKSILTAAIWVSLWAPVETLATSVLQVTVEQAVVRSELVFEGRVLSSRTDTIGNTPLTCFTIDVADIIAGEFAGSEIDICFAGGTLGKYALKIPAMNFPEIGEWGVYFVESLDVQQVNPLYGWSQGHYLVSEDETGDTFVTTYQGQIVTAVQSEIKSTSQPLSSGTAAGIKTRKTEPNAIPMNLNEFKSALRALANKAVE